MTQPDRDTRDRGHSTNLVGIPTGLLASAAYNDYPVPLKIGGVREMYASLFSMLRQTECASEAGEVFLHYMEVLFGLDHEQRLPPERPNQRRHFRSSYLRLLRGWGFDSNGPEGAVLKGWVESRFGLFPTFHKEILDRFSGMAWVAYVEEKMSSRFHNNAIHTQLDLLYEFGQWAQAHFFSVGHRHLTLFRGVNDFAEHPVVERIDKHRSIVRLNNLTSFTDNRDIADQFGSYILETRVPVTKVLFFNRLIPQAPLKGEAEFLVIGGDYAVTASTF